MSPGGAWVTIAMLISGVSADPAAMPEPEESGLPPVLLQADSPTARTAAAATAPTTLRGELTVAFSR